MQPVRASRISAQKAASLFLLAFTVAACSTPPAPDTRATDEAALRTTDTQWSQQAASKNLDATVGYYTDDASLLAPNAPVATGKKAIHDIWAPLLAPGADISWQAAKVEVARSGDLGYIVGTYQITATDPAKKSEADQGKFVEVWKKQADGKWKAIVDIFNTDLPAAAPPAAKAPAHHRAKNRHTNSRRRHA
jgi:ketosteroid isomerase-like protein